MPTPTPTVIEPVDDDTFSESGDDGEFSEFVIRPQNGWIGVNWKELFEARELLYFLVWRDVKVRYKQTALGVAWAVLQPLLSLVIFSVIFGRFAKIPSEGFPYPVFVFAGLVPWTFFANGIAQAGQSLVNQQQLLTKVYFPRLFIPTATIGAFAVDFVISFALYAALLAWYGVTPSWQVVYLPVLALMTLMTTLGVGLVFAGLTVLYRDFRHVIPFFVQIMMYLSPVIYPTDLVSPRYRWVMFLNPMTGLIEGYRSAVLGAPWDLAGLAASATIAVGGLALGLTYFRKVERRFADIA